MYLNLIIQYIIVGIILAGVAVAIAMKLVRLRRKGKIDGCFGCSLSDACNKKNKPVKEDCHEKNQDLE